ncbi:ANKRD49 [Mytilus edulis]|uniref:ANKRD49 n=1 Tax=Mytilus edulis TaxID=6550 RepID=A0A8S3UGP7_MYTED|nr:ANKRD49 [Mytilus edulis]
MDEMNEIGIGMTPELFAAMLQHQQAMGGFMFPGESDEDEDEENEEEIQNNPKKRILWAAENNHLDIVESILQSDPELIKSCDDDMYTPLHRACYNGHVDMVKLLIRKNADVNAKTSDGWQPIHSAARWNQSDVIQVLLEHNADINSQTNGGQTPLHLASSCKDTRETLTLLLSNPNTDRTIINNLGETAETICKRTSALCKLYEEIKT